MCAIYDFISGHKYLKKKLKKKEEEKKRGETMNKKAGMSGLLWIYAPSCVELSSEVFPLLVFVWL